MEKIRSMDVFVVSREISIADANSLQCGCGAMKYHYDVLFEDWTKTVKTDLQKEICNELFSCGRSYCQQITDSEITYQCPFFIEENGQVFCDAENYTIKDAKEFDYIISDKAIVKGITKRSS